MNIKGLIKTTKKPEIYTPGTASMWEDEHIATRLLEVHLNQNTDLASRKESTISSTIDWMLSKVQGDNLSILDLGCGPGLYTEKLAEKGHALTGVDFSANSIRYAKKSAKKKKLNISYIRQNYLDLEIVDKYDLIVMIFTDFCVLSPDQREVLLVNVYRALKPGGKFLFDVLNENYHQSESKEWELSENGFWKNGPYLALSESFYYEEQKVSLSQHTIIDEDGKMEVYRFWNHTFSHADLEDGLGAKGFRSIQCHDRVIPDSDLYRSESVTFCIAAK